MISYWLTHIVNGSPSACSSSSWRRAVADLRVMPIVNLSHGSFYLLEGISDFQRSD